MELGCVVVNAGQDQCLGLVGCGSSPQVGLYTLTENFRILLDQLLRGHRTSVC